MKGLAMQDAVSSIVKKIWRMKEGLSVFFFCYVCVTKISIYVHFQSLVFLLTVNRNL